jgi:hypothetical protein
LAHAETKQAHPKWRREPQAACTGRWAGGSFSVETHALARRRFYAQAVLKQAAGVEGGVPPDEAKMVGAAEIASFWVLVST